MDRYTNVDSRSCRPKRVLRGLPVVLLLLLGTMVTREFAEGRSGRDALQVPTSNADLSIAYVNQEYGFRFDLPQDWSGYSVMQEQWAATSPDHVVQDATGPEFRIRHPKYTEEEPYEDIPIMVLTHKQWKEVQKEVLVASAAPFPPREISHNSKYVFATPPRFYYDYATGYEQVLRILGNRPMHTFPPKTPPHEHRHPR